jgi:light-regulated signal transduction histidine kinase (bacteriophytochrome)
MELLGAKRTWRRPRKIWSRPSKLLGAMLTVDRLPIVQGNEIHLVRLFQNLICDAVNYRGEDPVEILVTAEPRGPDWVASG